MMRLLMIVFMTGVLGVSTALAQEMSVEEAYKAQKHKQTTFDKSAAQMSVLESDYLEHLFFVTDMAFRERMVMLEYFKKKRDDEYIEAYNKQIGELLASFDLIRAPGKSLKKVEGLVKESVNLQKEFFNEWHDAQGTKMYDTLMVHYSRHQLVRNAHLKLLESYSVLMNAYPHEKQHNRESFYNHLCALDFI